MPEVTQLDAFNVAVQPEEDGTGNITLLLTDTMLPRQYRVTLPPEAAEKIGKAMLAPRVAQPPKQNLVLPR